MNSFENLNENFLQLLVNFFFIAFLFIDLVDDYENAFVISLGLALEILISIAWAISLEIPSVPLFEIPFGASINDVAFLDHFHTPCPF